MSEMALDEFKPYFVQQFRLLPSLHFLCLSLVYAFFLTTRLDYRNSLLYGVPKEQIAKLQRVQNAAARLVMDIGKYFHIITPNLYDLRWLPIHTLIHFKILLLAFKVIHGQAPVHLSSLVSVTVNPNLIIVYAPTVAPFFFCILLIFIN